MKPLLESLRLWSAIPLLALLWLLFPDRSSRDEGLLRLAAAPAAQREGSAWRPVRMLTVDDMGMSPALAGQNPDSSYAERFTDNARRTLGSLVPAEPPFAAVQSPLGRQMPDDLDESARRFGLPSENVTQPIDFGRRGWLADTVKAAERNAAAEDSQLFPDLSGVLDTHVFGGNEGFLGRSSGFTRESGTDLFGDEDATDADLFRRSPGMTERDNGAAAPDFGLFDAQRGMQ
jgi:hypothetical protein